MLVPCLIQWRMHLQHTCTFRVLLNHTRDVTQTIVKNVGAIQHLCGPEQSYYNVPANPQFTVTNAAFVKKTNLPIWDGVRPFFANLKICSLTSSEDSFSHVGTLRRYGSADWDIPLLKIRNDINFRLMVVMTKIILRAV